MTAAFRASCLGRWSRRRSPAHRRTLRLGVELLESRYLLTNAGVLDFDFGVGGKVASSALSGASAVALTPAGKIVVAGSVWGDFSSDVAVAQLNADGALDVTFGPHRNGTVTLDLGFARSDVASAVAIQPDGKIVVAGTTRTWRGDDDFFLLRYHSDGTLDTGFGDQGKTITDIRNAFGNDVANGLAIDPQDGSIVVVGRTSGTYRGRDCVATLNTALCDTVTYPNWDTALARYDAQGRLLWDKQEDFTAANRDTAYAHGNDVAYAVAIHPYDGTQNAGKILIAGQAIYYEYEPYAIFFYQRFQHTRFMLARYFNDGVRDQSFGSGGRQFTAFDNRQSSDCCLQHAGAKAIAITPTGAIVAAGYALRGPREYPMQIEHDTAQGRDYDFALALYTANGIQRDAIRTTFGGNDWAEALAVQPDGKVLAAGTANFPGVPGRLNNDVAVVRYLVSCCTLSLDTTFGSGGAVTTNTGYDEIYDLVLQSDGRIVVAGEATSVRIGGVNGMQVIRYLNDLPDIFDQNEYERNDWPEEATVLADHGYAGGTRTWKDLSIHAPWDEDWFTFTTSQVGDARHFVEIRWHGHLGDLDLELYDRFDELIARAATRGTREVLSLAGLLPGTYSVRVFGHERATNLDYQLTLNAPVPLAADAFDLAPDDNNTRARATRLGPVAGRRVIDDLSLHDPVDADWFQFQTTQTGVGFHFARVEFDGQSGEVELLLFDEHGVLLERAAGAAGSAQTSLAGLPAGVYHLAAAGRDGATSPRYRLTIEAPGAPLPLDRFEPNQGRLPGGVQAYVLGPVRGAVVLTGPDYSPSIHDRFEEDWFLFHLDEPGHFGHAASIFFRHAWGDLDLYLYDAAPTPQLLRSSTSAADMEQISLDGLEPGWYFLRVRAAGAQGNPEYSLVISAPSPDWAEPNDVPGNPADASRAYDLRTVRGRQTWGTAERPLSINSAADVDWYRFELLADGVAGQFARIDFANALGDLNLYLYREGNLADDIRNSVGAANTEPISLAGLPAGTYYLKVQGFQGAVNPFYSITIQASDQLGEEEPIADWAEPNNIGPTPAAPGNAFDLGTVTGTLATDNASRPLSIHQPGDHDWFRFRLAGAGQSGHHVAISFNHAEGDLDLELTDARGNRLAVAEGIGDRHEISLRGYPAGEYYLHVYGHAGAINPGYALTVRAPRPLQRDLFDRDAPNDSRQTATRLGTIQGRTVIDGLSIDRAGDEDWFAFETLAAGGKSHQVRIQFEHALGDLRLELYDAAGQLLTRADGLGDGEAISLDNSRDGTRPPGTYYVRVSGHGNGDNRETNPSYSLMIDAPAAGDWLEPSNSPADPGDHTRARGLRTLSGASTWTELSIHAPDDVDWYRFQLVADGIASSFLAIQFDNALGDLDLALYDAEGQIVRRDGQELRSETFSNKEIIFLDGLPAMRDGTQTPLDYYLKVYGHRGATNPNYVLVSNTPTTTTWAKPDWAEPNDVPQNRDSAALAYDLHTVEGIRQWGGLSIHVDSDVDWFRFRTSHVSVRGHSASIGFAPVHGQSGVLTLELFGDNCTLRRAISGTTSHRQEISLEGLPAGEYCLRVAGRDNATTNPEYTLALNAPVRPEADWAEVGPRGSNNEAAAAYDLRAIEERIVLADLSLWPAGDVDWFRFETHAAGKPGDAARLDFNAASGHVQLDLYDARGETRLASATGPAGFVELPLDHCSGGPCPAGAYLLKVHGDPNPDYRLTLDVAGTLRPDSLERRHGMPDNDSFQHAVDLRAIESWGSESLLSLRPISGYSGGGFYELGGFPGFYGGNPARTDLVNTSAASSPVSAAAISQGLGPSLLSAIAGTARISPLQALQFDPCGVGLAGFSCHSPYSLENVAQSFAVGRDPLYGDSSPAGYLKDLQAIYGALAKVMTPASVPPVPAALAPAVVLPASSAASYGLHGLGLHSDRPPEASFGPLFHAFGNAGPLLPGPVSRFERPVLYARPDPFAGYGQLALPPPALSCAQNLLLGRPCSGSAFAAKETLPIAVIPGLSIHSPSDEDWYRFELTATAAESQYAGVVRAGKSGRLGITLLAADGRTELDRSSDDGDLQRLNLRGLSAGVYYLRVTASEPISEYSLLLNIPLTPRLDLAEPNDTGPTPDAPQQHNALDLRQIVGPLIVDGLSIHDGDVDWFLFQTTHAGRDGDRVRIDFDHRQGDLDLELYDASARLIHASRSTQDFEEVSLSGQAAGIYFVKVHGYQGATNPSYVLSVLAPESEDALPPDALEPNDRADQMTDLSMVRGISHLGGLTIHTQDQDFFRLETTRTGTDAHSVSIEFEPAAGELRLELRNNQCESVVRNAMPRGGTRHISLAGLPAGSYCVAVAGAWPTTANRYVLYVDAPTLGASPLNDWTILVYMTATDLGVYAEQDINELEQAAALLPASVNFAVFLDQSSQPRFQFATGGSPAWSGSGRAIIQPDTDPQRIVTRFDTSIGEKNSGDPQTLREFIDWAVAVAPARQYALILWDHGGGLEGFNYDDDSSPADPLTPAELAAALSGLPFRFGVLGFEACLMSLVEVADQLGPYAEYLVASQEVVAGEGYNHVTAFASLAQRPDRVTAGNLAAGIVRSFEAEHRGQAFHADTYSAIDTSRLDAFGAALKEFTTEALHWLADDPAHSSALFRNARRAATSFLNRPEYRDIQQFLDHVIAHTPAGAPLNSRAEQARAVLAELVASRTNDRRGTGGVSIYFPSPADGIDPGYAAQAGLFATDARSGWLRMLQAVVGAPGTEAEFQLDWAEANDQPALAYELHRLVGPGHHFSRLSLHNSSDVDWFRLFTVTNGTGSDHIRVRYGSGGSGRVALDLFQIDAGAPDGLRHVAGNSSEQISFAGLAAGQYLLRASLVAGDLVPNYELAIDAPVSADANEWVRGNDVRSKAYNLGTLRGEPVFAGLALQPGETDWFAFETPRNYRSVPHRDADADTRQLIVQAGGSTQLTATLFPLDGRESQQRTGTGDLVFPFLSGAGAKYEVSISSPDGQPARYTLRIANVIPAEGEQVPPLFQLVFPEPGTIADDLGYIEVLWTTGPASRIDTRTLDANDVSISSVSVHRVEPLDDGRVRYWYNESGAKLPAGVIVVAPRAGEVADLAGNRNADGEPEFFLRFRPACPWQNPTDAFDANVDGWVTPQDALVIINELNARRLPGEFGRLPLPLVGQPMPPPFYDVNCDNFGSPQDVLVVVNELNRATASSGEAESPHRLAAEGGVNQGPQPFWFPAVRENAPVPGPTSTTAVSALSAGDAMPPTPQAALTVGVSRQAVETDRRELSVAAHQSLWSDLDWLTADSDEPFEKNQQRLIPEASFSP